MSRMRSELQHLSAKLITAQEEERRSIARELHDEVGQVLTAIKVELAVAQRTMEASGGRHSCSRTRGPSPRARSPRSGISRICCTRRCWTIWACPRQSNGISAASAGDTTSAPRCFTTAWTNV